MKGTPFYEGDHDERQGPPEDRVNLWPLAYYRAPALSVLWPLGEFADDRTAFRPLFSMYRKDEDSPYDEINVLWPLAQFDRASGDNRVFPVFWGDTSSGGSYHAVFPLYYYGEASGDEARDTLVTPLWAQGADWTAVPPLLSWRTEERDGGATTHALLGLGGWKTDAAGAVGESWLFPFWYRDPESGTTVSPLWASGDGWSAIPPLLSWRTEEGDGGATMHALLGLGGWKTDGAGAVGESWLFPFWYRDPGSGTTVSPFWASGDGWSAIPPLLSWRTEEGDGGATTRALLGLGGWRTDGAGETTENWLFPLWYRDAAHDRLVTALWASGTDWAAVPPLLSWRIGDDDGGATTCALLGLGGWRTDAAGETPEHWLFPLWYRDAERDLFVSPLWASGEGWSAIPPLLSWRTEEEGGGTSERWLLGLGGCDEKGERVRDWLAPLWFHERDGDSSRFFSLAYAQSRRADGTGWTAIPPLLSWREHASTTARTRLLLGLAGWDTYEKNPDGGASWLLPLWYRDARSFYTPLFGHDASGGDRIDYWLTPLLGTRSGDWNGSWLFPLYTWAERPETDEHLLTCLLLGGSRRKADGTSANWFFPLWLDTDNPCVDSLLAEMDDPAAKGPSGFRRAEEYTWLLCGLAGSEREVFRRPWRIGWEDLDNLPSGTRPYYETRTAWAFPFWREETHRGVAYDPATGERVFDGAFETESVLWRLWDRRREFDAVSGHEYERTRVLWRLYHDETLDGDRSIDVFPGITIDRRKDGYRKTSVLWRLFRYESDPEKGDSLDILFLPILRP